MSVRGWSRRCLLLAAWVLVENEVDQDLTLNNASATSFRKGLAMELVTRPAFRSPRKFARPHPPRAASSPQLCTMRNAVCFVSVLAALVLGAVVSVGLGLAVHLFVDSLFQSF